MTLAMIRGHLRAFLCLTVLAIAAGGGGALVAQADAPMPAIDSSDPAALPRPEEWTCALIEPEYREWRRQGHPAGSFRFAGRTYRDVTTGELYDWEDWLAWHRRAACDRRALPPADRMAVATALTALGAGVLVASSGANAKSPG